MVNIVVNEEGNLLQLAYDGLFGQEEKEYKYDEIDFQFDNEGRFVITKRRDFEKYGIEPMKLYDFPSQDVYIKYISPTE